MRYSIGFVLVMAALFATSCGDEGESSPEAVCESYCAREAECLPPEYQGSNCEGFCLCYLQNTIGEAACGPALMQVYVCATGLSCGDLLAFHFQAPPDGYPCNAAFDDFEESMDSLCGEALMPCV